MREKSEVDNNYRRPDGKEYIRMANIRNPGSAIWKPEWATANNKIIRIEEFYKNDN